MSDRFGVVDLQPRWLEAAVKDARDRLIVALDMSSAQTARDIISAVGDAAHTYKVGKQLFTAEGPQFVRELAGSGLKVFLDLKFHDIPNTVAGAVKEASRLGVHMLTVHASGGGRMLRAAVEAARSIQPSPMVLAVTVLTSMEDAELAGVGVRGTILDQVLRLATLALANGCDGIVTSAHEAREVRSELGDRFLIVTPGVRPAGSGNNDQIRVVTPAEAVSAGATHIVVGRPITGAVDPASAARDIIHQISF
ncbi:MAG TPA: orotidine-5'-phosphate decarboxylase [Terriglobales bacterium]|nr:orotidine-5'-phosphate decarboxylase [Terriglobales bacterium]